MTTPSSFVLRGCAAAVLLAMAAGAAQARASVSVDLNFGLPFVGAHVGYGGYGGYYGHGYGPRGWGPGWGPRVILAPPVYGYGYGYGYPYPPVVVQATPPVVLERAPVSVAANRPDPVIYPRNGQDGTQTEADRQQCNRWATTQPAAVADASVFQRAVEACMDGRGYSMR